jgi:hypothetical protein
MIKICFLVLTECFESYILDFVAAKRRPMFDSAGKEGRDDERRGGGSAARRTCTGKKNLLTFGSKG